MNTPLSVYLKMQWYNKIFDFDFNITKFFKKRTRLYFKYF